MMNTLMTAEARENARRSALAHVRHAIALLERADLGDLAEIAGDLAEDIGGAETALGETGAGHEGEGV